MPGRCACLHDGSCRECIFSALPSDAAAFPTTVSSHDHDPTFRWRYTAFADQVEGVLDALAGSRGKAVCSVGSPLRKTTLSEAVNRAVHLDLDRAGGGGSSWYVPSTPPPTHTPFPHSCGATGDVREAGRGRREGLQHAPRLPPASVAGALTCNDNRVHAAGRYHGRQDRYWAIEALRPYSDGAFIVRQNTAGNFVWSTWDCSPPPILPVFARAMGWVGGRRVPTSRAWSPPRPLSRPGRGAG